MSSAPTAQPVPASSQVPMVTANGEPTPVWYQFFVSLWLRTGAGTGSISTVLDSITSKVGSILFRGENSWGGLGPGLPFEVLRMGSALPLWNFLDGNSFGAQNPNTFFAGPAATPDNVPVFRELATADLDSVAGAVPGIPGGIAAATGNVGEYVYATVLSGSAVPLTSGSAANVASISLTAGDWDVWGNVGVLPAAGASMTFVSAWVSATSANDPGAPNDGGYTSIQPLVGLTSPQTLSAGTSVLLLGVTATIYLGCNATFGSGTVGAFGFIGARRRR